MREQPSKAWRRGQKHQVFPGVRPEASGPHTCLDQQDSTPETLSPLVPTH